MVALRGKILVLALGLAAVNVWAQNVVLQVSTDRNRTRGEAILFKVKLETTHSGRVYAPTLDHLQDWEIVNSFRSESPSVVFQNGKSQYRYRAEYSYFMRPLKQGALKIPSLDVQIAGKTYKTDPITVQVDSLPGSQASRSRSAPPSRGRQLPPQFQGQTIPQTDPFEDPDADVLNQGGGAGSGYAFDGDVPERESFFIRPELKVKEAYVGQMIELSYVLYQRVRALRNFEMAKFPDFKGFLKEELFISKNFTQERVQVGNEVMLRSEIIRYALFPLKAGDLTIESFKIRAEAMTNPEDLINSLLMGTPPPAGGGGIPMEKSSGSVTVKVKELPPTIPGTVFTGAVGSFDIEMKGPAERLSVDQPFTVQFTIAGKGNVKMIEEPKLPLPPGLELFETKNTAELRPDTTGYKSFEYLILPRKNGELALESFKWSYFDPATHKYEVRETPRLVFQIEGSASPGSNGPTAAPKPVEKRISAFDIARVPLVDRAKRVARENLIWTGILGAIGALYLALGLAFARRRREDRHRARLKDNPWEKTAIAIDEKKYKDSTGLAILVDQWSREYLTGHLKTPELHAESSRAEFERALYRRLPMEFQQLVPELSEFWKDLDLVRFAGSEKWPIELKPQQLFPHAKELGKKIVARCKFEDDGVQEDDED